MTAVATLRLGVIINPYAGIGGPTGLKGSDGQLDAALARGGELRAEARALRCMHILAAHSDRFEIVSFAGSMGQDVLQQAGLSVRILGEAAGVHSSAEDTRRAAQAFMAYPVDLIVFAGGDGTARDVCSVVGTKVPVLGLPSGVKMQSGVFAVTPEAAAEVIQLMLNGQLVDLRCQEVRDIDEDAYRQGRVRSRYYGEMLVPSVDQFVQHTKSGGGGGDDEALVLGEIAAGLAEDLQADTLYLVGAGTTTQYFMDTLGLDNSLLGIDLLLNGKQVGKDCSASEIEAYLAGFSGPVVVILAVTGGQGSLVGRGNQQLTPAILRRIGKEGIRVIASKTKMVELRGRPLIIDTNDPELDQLLSGYYPIVVGYRDTIIYPASCGYGSALAADTIIE